MSMEEISPSTGGSLPRSAPFPRHVRPQPGRREFPETASDLRLLLDSAAEGICSIDRNGTITLANVSFLRMTGFRHRDEVLGKDIHELIHNSKPDGTAYPRTDCPVLNAAKSGNSAHATDEKFHRTDGSNFPVEYWVRPLVREGHLDGAVCTFVDITERKRSEAQQQLLTDELAHREKNTLAVVQAIVTQTLRNSGDPKDALQAINARLIALGNAHEMLRRTHWNGASIGDVVERGLAICGRKNQRIQVAGPRIDLGPKTALALTMTLHELCTNAVKYGALSGNSGTVVLDWRLDEAGGGRLHLRWKEQGGPPVAPPTRTGFGSRIIDESCRLQLGAEAALSFNPDGLEWKLEAPLRALRK